jgi:hypothetical protein
LQGEEQLVDSYSSLADLDRPVHKPLISSPVKEMIKLFLAELNDPIIGFLSLLMGECEDVALSDFLLKEFV